MNKLIIIALFCLAGSSVAAAQPAVRFPGISPTQMQTLRAARKVTPIPLPSWLPSGFKVEQVKARLGSKVPIEDRELVVIYSRTFPNGKTQRFAIEAGFEGLGDLMYDKRKVIRTPIGRIYLVYQPKDQDGKVLTDFAMTEWFDVGRVAFHYVGAYGADEEDGEALGMISLADTERILRSLRRF
jgi:hypothetical protein